VSVSVVVVVGLVVGLVSSCMNSSTTKLDRGGEQLLLGMLERQVCRHVLGERQPVRRDPVLELRVHQRSGGGQVRRPVLGLARELRVGLEGPEAPARPGGVDAGATPASSTAAAWAGRPGRRQVQAVAMAIAAMMRRTSIPRQEAEGLVPSAFGRRFAEPDGQATKEEGETSQGQLFGRA
jgi:hypothetical protein